MSQEIEIEFKNLLTEKEYKKLRTYFQLDDTSPIVQTNHYFETKAFDLKSLGAALRIREKNKLYQLTLKQPHPEGLLETHDTLSPEEALSWIHGDIIPKTNVSKQLDKLGIDFNKLHYGGALTTERLETTYKNTIIVLDHSSYNNFQDYELELEAKDKQHGESIFKALIEDLRISVKETPNKIQRFYSSLSY